MPTTGQADEAAIREKAYHFWEEDGRPEGRETEYWMRAVVAMTDKTQLQELTEPPRKAAKTKAAASKTKASPVKAEPAKKPKKK